MERAGIDGISLEYQVAGSGDSVVCIHGAFIADAFRPLLAEPALTARYQLIAYHRRGYAGSGRTPGPVRVDQQAADCGALLHHLGVTHAHVVGHSFGGCIALQLALDEPDLVHTLALLEPALMVGESGAAYREALVRSGQRYREAGAAVVVDEALAARWPGYRVELEQMLPGAFEQAVADAGAVFELDVGQLNWHFGEAEAKRIPQPVLSVLGSESAALWARFEETHRLLLEWLPQGEAFVLPGAAHGLQMQKPRELAAALAGFYARHPLPARPPETPRQTWPLA
jgi:pimeloyl-ACP methyl ester carboxylesterase